MKTRHVPQHGSSNGGNRAAASLVSVILLAGGLGGVGCSATGEGSNGSGGSGGFGTASHGTGAAHATSGGTGGSKSSGAKSSGSFESSSEATSSGTGGTIKCGTPCDAKTQVCSDGVCVPLTKCKSDNDCENDTYCDPSKGCLPWDSHMPPNDPTCVNVIAPGNFSPKIKCEFSQAPPGDPFPNHINVSSTPIVVNFHKPSSAGPPSILAPFSDTVVQSYNEGNGVIRILKGTDCTLEQNLGGTDLDGDGVVDYVVMSATLAVGDLDGDGIADIVAYGADGSTLAFTKHSGTWQLLWKAPYPGMGVPWAPCVGAFDGTSRCSNNPEYGWSGPSIHDIDNDGKPEVIREGVVFNGQTGALKSLQPANYASYNQGNFSVIANLDQDAFVELTNGQYVWKWKGGAWVDVPGFTGPGPGFVAIADFGKYGGAGIPSSNPEIAVVQNNSVGVFAIDGSVAMPVVAVPDYMGGPGGGGPPTIADFDGDGLPEIGVAGKGFYTVYDIDCGPNPRPGGKCSQGPCDFAPNGKCPDKGYYAWSRQSQDYSSDVTGSSVFDFEADGTSEVIYADECFVRVYNGKTGDVEFSQYHSSCTWYENPVVADVDGNFRADLVTPSNLACGVDLTSGRDCSTQLDANGVDLQFAGLHCKADGDCISGSCDQGLCRCTSSAQCCEAMDVTQCETNDGYKCVPPPAGTAGTGNTCRAAHPHGIAGIRVYSDAHDKWVNSRPIWNQHAYSVTNVNDDGTIPKTNQWMDNWTDPTLNNFRQNVPGSANGKATGDLTSGASDEFKCNGSSVELSAPICNRGSSPVGSGLSVGFYQGTKSVCESVTSTILQPGTCETVSCTWNHVPTTDSTAVDITVEPNDKHEYSECKPGNDTATIKQVFCKPAT